MSRLSFKFPGKAWLAVLLVGAVILALPQSTAAFPLLQTNPYAVNVTIASIVPDPVYINQPFLLTVRVQAVDPAAGVPTGVVRVESGSNLLCSLTLDASGEAVCGYTPTSSGTLPLKAIYLGESPFLPGVSSDTYMEVLPLMAPVIQFLSHTPNPSIINRVIDASVQVGPGSPTATGSVTMYRSATSTCSGTEYLTAADRCTAPLDASGVAACSMTLTAGGEVPLCAHYSGDVAHAEGFSAPVMHQVSLGNTFTTITSTDPNPSLVGQSVWVNFTVTSPDGPPSGTVVVTSGSSSCTATVAQGRCALVFSTPHLHSVQAAYGGATVGALVFDPSVSPVFTHRVNAAPTDIFLSPLTVDGYRAAGLYVGTFTTLDPNTDEAHVYSLVSGTGDTDNARFTISGSALFTAETFTPDEDLIVQVRATDPSSLYVERVFRISVTGELLLPNTGFPPGRVSRPSGRPLQPLTLQSGTLELEIPRLAVRTEITGVPRTGESWDTGWLGSLAGWLEGTAFPTWNGNSVLVGHNVLPSGLAGSFALLELLEPGDTLLVHGFGQTAVYEVQAVRWVQSDDLSVLRHSDDARLTLLTCASFDEIKQQYRERLVVQAVLVGLR